MREMTVTLVGIGGYGAMYCSAFKDPRFSDCRLVAAVDPFAHVSPELAYLKEKNAQICPGIADLRSFPPADLAIVASPLQFHAEHTIELLAMGTNVLCEKPLCGSLEQATDMAAARDLSKRHLAIGYQWSYSNATQQLKADVQAGLLGAPKRMRTVLLWPRDEKYYARNRWAGRRTDDTGRPIYDSPVNNAAAHFLHNILYVLGEKTDRSARALSVTAELYRGHAIENYDTAAIRCELAGGVEVLFIASHSATHGYGPVLEYEFEQATVRYEMRKGVEMIAHFADGRVKSYGSPEESHYNKLLQTISRVRNGEPPLCSVEAAVVQTQVMLAAQQSSEVTGFPAARVSWQGELGSRRIAVERLDEQLLACHTAGQLPSEMGYDWAVPGRRIAVDTWPVRPQLQHLEAGVMAAPATRAFRFGAPARPAPRS